MKAFAFAAGRRAASGLVAGAAATAAQPSAQAREIAVQQAPSVPQTRRVEDQDWLVTDLDQEVLVFKPFKPAEVDAALEQVHAMMQGGSPTVDARDGAPSSHVFIEELDQSGSPPSEAESFVSMGTEADLVLGQSVTSAASVHSLTAAAGSNQAEMHDFLKLAGKLLKRPGLQREVFKCMLEDDEVRDLMLRQSRNIDAYLAAVGVHNPALLPAPESHAVNSDDGEEAGEGKDVLQNILRAVADCIDKTGSWLTGLGGWFKDRIDALGSLLSHAFGLETESTEQDCKERATEGEEGGSPRSGGVSKGGVVMGAVLVVTAAVFCVLLARSPVVRTVAAGAAATMYARNKRASTVGL